MTRLGAISAALLLAGCAGAPAKPAGPTDGDLQPLERGATWTYVSNGVLQTRTVAGDEKVGRFPCKVVEIRTGNVLEKQWLRKEADGLKLHRVLVDGHITDLEDPALVMKYPGRVGDSWTYDERVGPVLMNVTGLYVRDESVSVPAGTFNAARIQAVKTIQGEVVVDQVSWYARGTGLVKLQVRSFTGGKEMRIVLELDSYQR